MSAPSTLNEKNTTTATAAATVEAEEKHPSKPLVPRITAAQAELYKTRAKLISDTYLNQVQLIHVSRNFCKTDEEMQMEELLAQMELQEMAQFRFHDNCINEGCKFLGETPCNKCKVFGWCKVGGALGTEEREKIEMKRMEESKLTNTPQTPDPDSIRRGEGKAVKGKKKNLKNPCFTKKNFNTYHAEICDFISSSVTPAGHHNVWSSTLKTTPDLEYISDFIREQFPYDDKYEGTYDLAEKDTKWKLLKRSPYPPCPSDYTETPIPLGYVGHGFNAALVASMSFFIRFYLHPDDLSWLAHEKLRSIWKHLYTLENIFPKVSTGYEMFSGVSEAVSKMEEKPKDVRGSDGGKKLVVTCTIDELTQEFVLSKIAEHELPQRLLKRLSMQSLSEKRFMERVVFHAVCKVRVLMTLDLADKKHTEHLRKVEIVKKLEAERKQEEGERKKKKAAEDEAKKKKEEVEEKKRREEEEETKKKEEEKKKRKEEEARKKKEKKDRKGGKKEDGDGGMTVLQDGGVYQMGHDQSMWSKPKTLASAREVADVVDTPILESGTASKMSETAGVEVSTAATKLTSDDSEVSSALDKSWYLNKIEINKEKLLENILQDLEMESLDGLVHEESKDPSKIVNKPPHACAGIVVPPREEWSVVCKLVSYLKEVQPRMLVASRNEEIFLEDQYRAGMEHELMATAVRGIYQLLATSHEKWLPSSFVDRFANIKSYENTAAVGGIATTLLPNRWGIGDGELEAHSMQMHEYEFIWKDSKSSVERKVKMRSGFIGMEWHRVYQIIKPRHTCLFLFKDEGGVEEGEKEEEEVNDANNGGQFDNAKEEED